jgi:hypothetical protein
MPIFASTAGLRSFSLQSCGSMRLMFSNRLNPSDRPWPLCRALHNGHEQKRAPTAPVRTHAADIRSIMRPGRDS